MEHSERQRAAREAARRWQAIRLLRLVESGAGYAAAQLSDGLSPDAAREAALEMAEELSAAAGSLRRLALPELPVPDGLAERRALAVRLAGWGMSEARIAVWVGRSKTTVHDYLRQAR